MDISYENINEVIETLMPMTDGKTITEIAEIIRKETDADGRWYLAHRLQCEENSTDIAMCLATRRQIRLKPNLKDGVIYYYNDRIIYA